MANQDKYAARVEQLLRDNGAQLIRQKKHRIYKLSNGAQLVMSSTPSDVRVSRKRLTDLKHILVGRAQVETTQPSHNCETLSALPRSRGQEPWPPCKEADVVIPPLELGLGNSVQTVREPTDVDAWVLLRRIVPS